MQRALGNQAALAAWGGFERRPRGMVLSQPGDSAEREADAVSDAIVADSSALPRVPPRISRQPVTGFQRMCTECDEEADEQHGTIARKANARDGSGGDIAPAGLAGSDGGRPLSAAELAYFGPRFGRDLTGVRLHTDAPAAGAARALSARAFTHGHDVFFAAGAYEAGSATGRRLLAHELTHVIQQTDPHMLPAGSAAVREPGASESEHDPAALLDRLGAGDPLDTGVRARMERAFGATLPDVRVHRDADAATLVDGLHARAFTLGRHVAFARGAWQPGSPMGDLLIAHELAHVLQQRDAADQKATRAAAAESPALERDATSAAVGAVASLWRGVVGFRRAFGSVAAPRMRSGLSLQRCAPTTPDGVKIGPTDKSKVFCLKPGSFVSTTSVDQNTTTAAAGRQDMKFEGLNTGTQDGLPCDCSCGLYRHWIRGFYIDAGSTSHGHDVSSCGHSLTLSETDFKEEYTSCIGDNDPDACKWSYADGPGFTSLSEGDDITVNFDFIHQVWDRCQGRSVDTHAKSLRITGKNAPRSITWT